MLLPRRVERYLSYYFFTTNIEDLPKLFREERDAIINSVPKTYRRRVEKFVDAVIGKEQLIRKAFNLELDYVNNIIPKFIDDVVNREFHHSTVKKDEYIMLANIAPIYVEYEKRGVSHSGLLLDPTKREIESVTNVFFDSVLYVLGPIISKNIQLDMESSTIKIGSYERGLSTEEMRRLVTTLARWNPNLENLFIKHVLRMEVGKLMEVDKLMEGGLAKDAVWSEDRKSVTLTVEPVPGFPERVKLTASVRGLGAVFNTKYQGVEVKGYWVLSFEDSIVEQFRNVVEKIRELYTTVKRIRKQILDIAKHNGLTVEKISVESSSIESHKTEATLRNTKYTVNLTDYGITISTKVGIKNSALLRELREYLRMHRLYARFSRTQDGYLLSIFVNAGLTDAKDEIKYIMTVLEKGLQYVDNLYKSHDRVKSSGKLTLEKAVMGLLLVPAMENVEAYTGYPLVSIYSKVMSYLRKADPEEYNRVSKYNGTSKTIELITALVKTGYINVDDDGEITIGGKRMLDVMNEHFSQFTIAVPLLVLYMDAKQYFLTIMSNDSNLFKTLNGKPKVIEFMARHMHVYLNTNLLLVEHNGKPLWDSLPTEVKKDVINKLPIYKVDELLKLHPSMSKEEIVFILEQLANKFPNEVAQMAVQYLPEVYGASKHTKTVKIGSMLAFKVGEFLVAPVSMSKVDTGSQKWFIVFSTEDRLGVPVRGSNLRDAVMGYKEAYQELMKEVSALKQRRVKVGLHRLDGYQLYVVEDEVFPYRKHIVYPGMHKHMDEADEKSRDTSMYSIIA